MLFIKFSNIKPEICFVLVLSITTIFSYYYTEALKCIIKKLQK